MVHHSLVSVLLHALVMSSHHFLVVSHHLLVMFHHLFVVGLHLVNSLLVLVHLLHVSAVLSHHLLLVSHMLLLVVDHLLLHMGHLLLVVDHLLLHVVHLSLVGSHSHLLWVDGLVDNLVGMGSLLMVGSMSPHLFPPLLSSSSHLVSDFSLFLSELAHLMAVSIAGLHESSSAFAWFSMVVVSSFLLDELMVIIFSVLGLNFLEGILHVVKFVLEVHHLFVFFKVGLLIWDVSWSILLIDLLSGFIHSSELGVQDMGFLLHVFKLSGLGGGGEEGNNSADLHDLCCNFINY